MFKSLFTTIALCICMSLCSDGIIDDDVITEFVVSYDMLDLDFEEMAIDDGDNEAAYEGLMKAKRK